MNARTNANLFNMSYFGKFYLSGPDSTKAAEWIFSNNMDKEPGRLILLVVTRGHVLTLLPLCDISLEFPEIRSRNHIRYYWLSVSGTSPFEL